MHISLRLLPVLLGGLWLALAPLPHPAAAQSPFTPAQRDAIVAILRETLKSDPSVLRDAIAALQQDDTKQQEAAVRTAIAAAATELAGSPGDPVWGNPKGDATLVEFTDVRCPYCRRMVPVVADLLRKDPNVRLVIKDIPILGPASVLGARAVLAAQKQDAEQRMRDALMAGTPDITEAVLKATAEKLGLDWAKLSRDMQDPSVQARIEANLALARKLEIQGTPAYVAGTHLIPGAVGLAELQDAVRELRGKK